MVEERTEGFTVDRVLEVEVDAETRDELPDGGA